MKKKIIIAVLLLLVLACAAFGCAPGVGENAVVNGGFESLDADDSSVVTDWKANSESSAFKFVSNNNDGSDFYLPELGKKYAALEKTSAIKQTDYLYQSVRLQGGKTYRLAAKVRVDSISPTNSVGARIAFLEDDDYLGLNVYEKTGGWRDYEVYFTAQSSRDMTLIITLGNARYGASGSVYFDNVVLERVSSVPDGVTPGTVVHREDTNITDAGSTAFVVVLAIVSVILIYFLYFVFRKVLAPAPALDPAANGTDKVTKIANALASPFAGFIYIMLGAFVVRFVILLTSYGYAPNTDALSGLGTLIANGSFLSVMAGEAGTGQPLGLVYLMGILGKFAAAVGIENGSVGYSVIVRLPAIIADIVTLYILFNFVQKHTKSDRHANVFSAIYAFLPVFFVYGVMYGSLDIIAVPFLLAMGTAMADKKYVTPGIWYTCALIFSYNALLLLPIILLYQIYGLATEKEARVKIGATMAGCFFGFYALSVAPTLAELQSGNVLFIFKHMYAFFKTQAFLSTDAFNLYGLFAKTNAGAVNTLLDVCNWLFVAAMAGCAVAGYIKSRNRLDLLLYSGLIVTLYAALGAKSNPALLPIGLVLLLAYTALVPDRRLYGVLAGYSTISFVNIAHLMAVNGVINGTAGNYIALASDSPLMIVFSLFTVLVALFSVYTAVDIVAFGAENTVPPLERKWGDEAKYLLTFGWLKRK